MRQSKRRHYVLTKIQSGRDYVQKYGREILPGFKIDSHNAEVIDSLIHYFHGNPTFTLPGGTHGNPEKGILLLGQPGVGKTLLLELFSKYVTFDQMYFLADGKRCPLTFPIVRTDQIVSGFSSFGHEEIDQYIRRRVLCLDDLGEETMEANHFGTRLNVLQHIMEARYSRSCLTLATSNHNLKDLSEMYGSRIASRIPEMFNLIALHGPDRRSPAYQQSLPLENKKAVVNNSQ